MPFIDRCVLKVFNFVTVRSNWRCPSDFNPDLSPDVCIYTGDTCVSLLCECVIDYLC